MSTTSRARSTLTSGPDTKPFVLEIRSRTAQASVGYQRIVKRRTSWSTDTWQVCTRLFDGLGRRFQDVVAAPYDQPVPPARFVTRKLDSKGRTLARSLPSQEAGSLLWVSLAYDPLGRVIQRTSPLDGGRSRITKIIHDGMDSTEIRDQGGKQPRVTVKRYTLISGKPVLLELTDPLGNDSVFSCDVLGRLVRASPPGDGPQQITYDSLGNRRTLSGQCFGTITFTNDPIQRTLHIQFANGRSLTRTRDRLGRVTLDAYDDGSRDELSYDTVEGNALGRLRSVRHVDASGEIAHTRTQSYDALGRVTSLEVQIGGTDYTQTRVLEPSGRTDTLVYPDASQVRFQFNGLGDLLEIQYLTDSTGSPRAIANYSGYNAYGRPSQIDHGNGTATSVVFDSIGNTRARTLSRTSGAVISHVKWEYSDLLQIKSAEDTVGKVSTDYEYDDAGQLRSAIATPSSKPVVSGVAVETAYDYYSSGDIQQAGDLTLEYARSDIKVTGKPTNSALSWVIRHDDSGNRIAVLGPANRAAIRVPASPRREVTSCARRSHERRKLAALTGVAALFAFTRFSFGRQHVGACPHVLPAKQAHPEHTQGQQTDFFITLTGL